MGELICFIEFINDSYVVTALLIIGTTLICINIYGLFQSIEPKALDSSHVYFKGGNHLSYESSLSNLQKQAHDSDASFADRANKTISNRIVHIHWFKYDMSLLHQLIPIWENYFLYFLGRVLAIPEFQRYHYADYKRSLKRGVGVCGDKAMVLSQALNIAQIENVIISFARHVVVEARHQDGSTLVYDPDFGLCIPFPILEINKSPDLIRLSYEQKEIQSEVIDDLIAIYASRYRIWKDTRHFITKRYWFEKLSYSLKWLLPVSMITIAAMQIIQIC